jgi:predicted nucleic acid-binding protein
MTKKDSFLFDTSSLLYILKAKQYQRLSKKCHILDLTFYEYGNAVLNILGKRNVKDSSPRPSAEEGTKILLHAYEKIAEQITILTYQCNLALLLDIFELAKKENLTFYDASYLHYCLIHNLSFVTEDKQLAAAAIRNSIDAMDADRWTTTSS